MACEIFFTSAFIFPLYIVNVFIHIAKGHGSQKSCDWSKMSNLPVKAKYWEVENTVLESSVHVDLRC